VSCSFALDATRAASSDDRPHPTWETAPFHIVSESGAISLADRLGAAASVG
jgi:hypothetical protein